MKYIPHLLYSPFLIVIELNFYLILFNSLLNFSKFFKQNQGLIE